MSIFNNQPILNTSNTPLFNILLNSINSSISHFNYENALFLSQQLHTLFPNENTSLYTVALCHYHLQQYSTIHDLLINHEYPPSRFLYAKACIKLHKYQQAELCLIDIPPHPSIDQSQVLHLLGISRSRVNRSPEAIESFSSALKCSSNSFLWTCLQELCELGYSCQNNPIFIYKSDPGPTEKSQTSISSSLKDKTITGKKRTRDNTVSKTSFPIEHSDEPQISTFLKYLNTLADGYIHLSNYNCQKAIKIFQSLEPNQYCEQPWVLNQIAKAFYELNNYKEAEKYFRKVRQLEPWRMQYMDIYGTCLWQLRKDVELSYLAQELQQTNKTSPETWCVVGNMYSRVLEHDQAIKAFKRAIQLDSYFAYAHTLCGHEYILNEDLDNAALHFREAIRINPRHYNAWYGLASVFMKQEKYLLSEYHFKKALEIYKDNPLLHSHVAMVIQKDKSRYQESLERFKIAEKLAPNQLIYKFRKAHTMMLMGDYQNALKELLILASQNIAECNVHYLMGRIYKQLGRLKDAIRCFTLAQDRLSNKASSMVKEAIENIGDCEEICAEDLKLFNE